MEGLLSGREGELLTKKAREAVEMYFRGSRASPARGGTFDKSRAIFVTISTMPGRELRGCIGFLRPVASLGEAVCDAAVHAAFEDPRFAPLRESELSKIVFEASVLTPPRLLECPPQEREKHVKIPGDGLIVQYGPSSGLLLPQVALEWNFKPREFLEAVCQKAGLPKGMYKSSSAKIYTFRAQIFEEKSPEGRVVQKKLYL